MASGSQLMRAYPKRKRAEVSYYESTDSGEESEDEVFSPVNEECEDEPPKKKLKGKVTKAISPGPLPKRQIFPFKSLPAELKNQIYEAALTDENGIALISRIKHYRRTVTRDVPTFTHSTSTQARRRRRYAYYRFAPSGDESAEPEPAPKLGALVPNILLLDREIYAQTQPILYGSNDFIVEDTMALHGFLAAIGPKNCAALTDLTIKDWGWSKAHKAMNHPALTLLASATNLERLCIDCEIHWGGPSAVARQFYRDGFHYLEDVGAAKGRFDAAIDVVEVPPDKMKTYRYSNGAPDEPTPEEKMNDFRKELRKLMESY